jgi:pimeloyl-ACP methyl ester carboxylesterase
MELGVFLTRSPLLQAVGAAVVAGGARYYFTHPQRVVAELPPDLALDGQHVNLRARDGARLHAIWLPCRRGQGGALSDRTIIHHHGFNGSAGVLMARGAITQRGPIRLPGVETGEPLFAWPLVRAGRERGYNFLLVDGRGHGRSDGPWDPSGVRPASDLSAWVRWLRETYDQLWVGLWGNSYGSALGLGLAARPAGGGFDAMVLDSPLITATGLYSGVLREPVYLALQLVMQGLGNPELPRLLERAHVWMPILLIHGQQDRHVPAWQAEQIFQLICDAEKPELCDLWRVEAADHLQALEVAPAEYIRRTFAWFDYWM